MRLRWVEREERIQDGKHTIIQRVPILQYYCEIGFCKNDMLTGHWIDVPMEIEEDD